MEAFSFGRSVPASDYMATMENVQGQLGRGSLADRPLYFPLLCFFLWLFLFPSVRLSLVLSALLSSFCRSVFFNAFFMSSPDDFIFVHDLSRFLLHHPLCFLPFFSPSFPSNLSSLQLTSSFPLTSVSPHHRLFLSVLIHHFTSLFQPFFILPHPFLYFPSLLPLFRARFCFVLQ